MFIRLKRFVLFVILLTLVMAFVVSRELRSQPGRDGEDGTANREAREAIEKELDQAFRARAKALLEGGAADTLDRFYDLSAVHGRWALEREKRKVNYVNTWAAKRGVRFIGSDFKYRIHNFQPKGDTVWLSLSHTLRLDYVYPDAPESVNSFGIGTRHAIQVVRKGDRWLIRREWYSDPLGEDAVVPEVRPADLPSGAVIGVTLYGEHTGFQAKSRVQRRAYDREAAVAYADRYCGRAWGCGNNHQYNRRYRDYTYIGGDCTNFVSQAMGDREGGKLPQDGVWYHSPSGEGSQAWVQASRLASYLIYSGRARLVAKGQFSEVVQPTAQHPDGAISSLEKGDLIAYQEKGRLEHFAIITGFDSKGYPLVNTHTADRYRVPWDLGWDRKTVFWLLQINY